MSGHTVILTGQAQRDNAHRMIDRAPPGYVVSLAEPKRTREQNDKMYAMLTDISRAKPLGRKMVPDSWKAVLMHACGHACQFEMGINGEPFPLGFRSSKMTKSQMTTFIEYLLWFGAEHGVTWSNEGDAA